jgi:hypothetical protein
MPTADPFFFSHTGRDKTLVWSCIVACRASPVRFLLIEKGADFNKATTDNGTTPLIIASQKGTISTLRDR